MQLYDTFNNKTIPTDETRCYFQRGGVYKSVRITVSRDRKRIATTWHYNENKSVLENWADLINAAKSFEQDPIAFEREKETAKIKRVTVQELYPKYLESEKAKSEIEETGVQEPQQENSIIEETTSALKEEFVDSNVTAMLPTGLFAFSNTGDTETEAGRKNNQTAENCNKSIKYPSC